MPSYCKGIRYRTKKDISKETTNRIIKAISKILVEDGHKGSKIHEIGKYDLNLNEIWKDCRG